MIEPSRWMLFTLIIMRMSAMILFNPILGRRNVPNIVKAGFIVVLSALVFSFTTESVTPPNSVIEYGVLLLKEAMVGYVLGFVVNLFLYIIIFAGEFIDMQMGLSMAKIYDASTNSSISISATYYNALFMLMFFAAQGHIAMLEIIIKSAEIVPYGGVIINPGITQVIIEIFVTCTVFGLSFTMPIFATEMIGEMAVGVLMKTIPQINVFVVNIQAKVFLGLLMILIMYAPMSEYLRNLIPTMFDTIRNTLEIMGPF